MTLQPPYYGESTNKEINRVCFYYGLVHQKKEPLCGSSFLGYAAFGGFTPRGFGILGRAKPALRKLRTAQFYAAPAAWDAGDARVRCRCIYFVLTRHNMTTILVKCRVAEKFSVTGLFRILGDF